ncbi:MAG: hypothetical protein A3H96_03995 [Acidobacteria bacterium RIFCSPLOWO2_02_FULL_67_36]|nr:MAG: hypothetical protein A3H96_03995 [Acidobacteria bacterium RIFCSPLOWO2_02_FULL_67_36]
MGDRVKALVRYLERDAFPWTLALSVYVISHGLSFLFLGAVFWDDWTLVDVRPEVILDVYRQNGSVFAHAGYLHIAMLTTGPAGYHILTFVLLFASGVLVWAIVRAIPEVHAIDRSLIAILIVTAPLYSARVALIVFPYTLRLFLFFWAWYLLVTKRRTGSRVLSFALFALSVNTPSLLVFYLLPCLHLLCQTFRQRSEEHAARAMLWIVPFGGLPLLFWFVKRQFFRPYGLLEGYNEINLGNLQHDLPWLVAGLAYTLVFVAVWRYVKSERLKALSAIPIGLWILWLAVVPYRAIGFGVPIRVWWDLSFYDWWSRHQLLLPLGFAVVVTSVDKALRFKRVPVIVCLVVVASVAYNVRVESEYYVDWTKQREIIRLLGSSEDVRKSKTILFEDDAAFLNARTRTFRHYEYNGWLKRAYGDETRFAMDRPLWRGSLSDQIDPSWRNAFSEKYNAGQYVAGVPDALIRIHAANGRWRTFVTGSAKVSLEVSLLHAGR